MVPDRLNIQPVCHTLEGVQRKCGTNETPHLLIRNMNWRRSLYLFVVIFLPLTTLVEVDIDL